MEAAFFDLDKTVIARASMVAFGRPLYRAGYISRWLLLRALYGQAVYLVLGASEERLTKMRDTVMRLTRGWDQTRIRALVAETLDEVIEPIIYQEALDLIRMHQEAGRRVYIVSASPEEIVVPLARHIGVDHVIATRAEIDDEGRYAGRIEFYSYGPNKAVAIRAEAQEHGIDLDASYAYSDSATDIPMMEVVGHAVAVNPDRELLRAARDNGWEVMRFIEPIRVRARTETRSWVPVLVSTGVAVAAGGGVVVGAVTYRRRRARTRRWFAGRAELAEAVRALSRRGGGRVWPPTRRPVRRTSPSWRPRRRGR